MILFAKPTTATEAARLLRWLRRDGVDTPPRWLPKYRRERE